MTSLPILDSHSPLLRVESLHAWAYCPRLFYFQEVERITVENARVFAGRQLHSALEADEDGDAVSLELTSDTLGLTGKVDCLRRRDGVYLPYEHKRGQPARPSNSEPTAWPSDRLQIIAYAVLLEEAFGQNIPEGRIRYHAGKTTVRVAIDTKAREDLLSAIREAGKLRESLDRPPITENEKLCTHCSLAPVCLPEEVRQDRTPEHNPLRLFPPDRDGVTLHVVAQGARVGVSVDTLTITPREGTGEVTKHPIRGVEAVLIHGYGQISTQAIRKCTEHGTDVHWLSVSGYHIASLVATAGQVQRRIRQYQALTEETTCLRLVRQLAHNKVEGQYRYLLRATRSDESLREKAQPNLEAMKPILEQIGQGENRDEVRGLEGAAAVQYFAGLRHLLTEGVPDEFRSESRSRRPPLDRFNALLGFGYGLLHTSVMRAILATGLEPALGFFHTPRSAAYPLVLDLMELFRVTIWDITLMGSLNRKQWHPLEDFEVTKTKVWLSEAGRKKAIGLFESRLQETWKHPVLDYSLSYARTIELEARLLEKEWSGEPGLFARSRLR